MSEIGYFQFLQQLPPIVARHLAPGLSLNWRQPHRWLLQFYDQDKTVHYEIQRLSQRRGFELGLHFESRKEPLNNHLRIGFSRRLIEIRDCLGDQIEVEPWDRGWSKLYEIYAPAALTGSYQDQMGQRMAAIINCLHPILLEIYEQPLTRPAAQLQRRGS